MHNIIPKMLDLFTRYDIHATWAIVGLLYFKNKEDLLKHIPDEIPAYEKKHLDPYHYISSHSLPTIYHFAPAIIELIRSTPNQEIGTHTFCHYYALEKGQTYEQFKKDITAALQTQLEANNICKSIVFPRNQYTREHLKIIKDLGIEYYRGGKKSWLFKPRAPGEKSWWITLLRVGDSYINITGHNTFRKEVPKENMPVNVPASQFLRPYRSSLMLLEVLKLRRIVCSMTHAAKHGEAYHLWWHPHNFGRNGEKNFEFLEKILKTFQILNKKYGFTSRSMKEY